MSLRFHSSKLFIAIPAVGLILGVILGVALNTATVAQEAPQIARVPGEVEVLSSLEELQARLGFPILLPSYLPGGISFRAALVDKPSAELDETQLGPPMLVFASGDGRHGFLLMEATSKRLRLGDPEAKPSNIQGVEGQVSQTNRGGRERLAISWAKEDVDIIVSAFVDEVLTKEALLDIIRSIGTSGQP